MSDELFKCQICDAPLTVYQFCDDCQKEIDKRFNKLKKYCMSRAIREVTLEIREKQYQERLNK